MRDPGAFKPPLLELEPRRCPLCGSDSEARVIEGNLDAARIDGHSFASRKEPEYMHYRLVQCSVCDLLYANPVPSADTVATAYRDALYDSADEARFAAATYAQALQRFQARLPPRGGALDIGAGDGAFVAELIAAGFDDALGVEPSSAPIASAPPELQARLRNGVFRAADFEPGGYRLITAFQVLEHIADPLGVCHDAHTLLGEGGALFVIAHDRRAAVNRMMGRRSPIYDIEHLQLFSRRSLVELFARAGFERVALHSFLNRYPLRYWLRLFPFPQRVKKGLLNWVGASRVGGLSASLPVGNIAAIGFKGPGGQRP
jgi:SAM-dependent methyltransferase